MLPEQSVYRVLNESKELTETMDDIRGKSLDDTPIYTTSLPDEFILTADSPVIRITFITDTAALFADDTEVLTDYHVQVDFWTHTLAQAAKLQPVIDAVMNKLGYFRYFSDRYKDPDSSSDETQQLLMSIRRYSYSGAPTL